MFEFDPVKSEANIAQRGLPFQLAELLFDGPYIEEEDARRDYGEPRFIATGPIAVLDGRPFVVVYTWRGPVRRVISFSKANNHDARE